MADAYDDALRTLLLVPPPPDAFYVLWMPSFHRECLIAVDGPTLRISTPTRSIWAWTQREGGAVDRASWVEPAISQERLALTVADQRALLAMSDGVALVAPPGSGVILDGLPATFARGGEHLRVNLSALPHDHPLVGYVRTLLSFAQARARWDASRSALEDVGRYLPVPHVAQGDGGL